MAQLLSTLMSSNKLERIMERHQRLCNRMGLKNFAEVMESAKGNLEQKKMARITKEKEQDFALDDFVYVDTITDNAVISLFHKTKEYDRDNLGTIIVKIFPESKYTTITKANRKKQPILVEQLAVRVESLGENHILYPYAEKLRTHTTETLEKIKAYHDAIYGTKAAEAEEFIAKTAAVEAYSNNYHNACIIVGKKDAELLFPKINEKHTTTVVEPVEE